MQFHQVKQPHCPNIEKHNSNVKSLVFSKGYVTFLTMLLPKIQVLQLCFSEPVEEKPPASLRKKRHIFQEFQKSFERKLFFNFFPKILEQQV